MVTKSSTESRTCITTHRTSTLRSIALLVFLLAFLLPAQGQAVIMNGNYYLTHNEAGTSVETTATTEFNPATCLWYYVSRDYIRTANSNGEAIDNNNNYLQYTSVSLGTDWGNWNRGNNNEAIRARVSNGWTNTNYYLRLNGTTWQFSTTNSNNGTLYNATITTQGPTDNTTLPTISIASNTSNTITFSHSDLSGTYVPQYTRYVFNGGTHNWYNNTDYGNTAPSVNVNTLSPTYTWSLVANGGGVATFNTSTGVLTLSGAPTGNITVRLTVGNISPLANKTVDFTLTPAAIAENITSTTTITGPTLTPASAALHYNEGSQTFTATASASTVTSTTPAYTTLSGGGYTYYYYNGMLNNAAPSPNVVQTNPDVTLAWTLSGAAATNLSLSSATGQSTTVTHTTQAPADRTATLTVTASAAGASNKQATATVTAYGPMAAPTISRTGNSVSLATASLGATIYYTTDGTTPSAGTTPYSGPFDLTTSPTTVKAIAIRDGHPSDVTTQVLKIQLAPPTISIGATGLATLTAEAGATIHYTTDGSTPTDASPTYSAPVQLTNPQTIMAIAVRDGYDNSEVASDEYITGGISGGKVVLNDLEDHTWTYYNTKPDSDYPDNLHSPDPRNVKITYRGGSVSGASAVAVSATEDQNEFIYLKTIEKKAWGTDEGRWLTGNYAYKVIPNPFQKRPKLNTTYYGFAGWKIVSGGEYISGHNNNDVLDLEEKINFVGLDNGYTPNCISAEIVFEATWTEANVVTVTGDVTGDAGLPAGGTYETNFIVVSGNDRTVTGMTRNATVMGCYPDGTGATGARLSTVTGSGNDLKIENINLGTGGSDFTANTGWLIVGRGCTGNVRRVIGNTGQIKIRIESGLYNFINPMSGGSANNANYGLIIFGNDYDRATNDGLTSNDQYADNSSHRKLRVINYVSFNGSGACKSSNDNRDEWMDITIKSGYYGYSADYSLYTSTADNNADGFGLGIGGNTDHAGTYTAPDINGTNRTYTNLNAGVNNTTYRWQRIMSFYCGRTRGGNYGGINRVLVEGGELNSINGGGYRNTGNNFDVCYHFRMRGGWVKGAIYGTASSSMTNATTKQVITGGEINGWVAGACNGTDVDNDDGRNEGDTYIYLGGTAELRSHRNDGVYNNAWGLVGGVEGGNIFASGRGTPATNAQPNRNYCGSSYKTYTVVADQAQVEQGVYGGGYIGLAQNSHIYITGGTTGKVFGGASTPTSTNNTWMTQTTDIRQYGGTVKEGIYGGHFEGTGNAGKIHQTVNIAIDGGQVGVDANHTANIHGGGYGDGTSVGGNVTVTLGISTSAEDSVTVYGNVFGGGALGNVNTNASNTTTVTMNKALINGNLFGGALGQSAVVNGLITVNILGGRVNGSVFGGGDAAAYGTAGWNYPVVNMSGGTVRNIFGGGKGSTARVTGNPQVTLSGKAHVTGNVYGGGDAAEVTGQTNVRLQD